MCTDKCDVELVVAVVVARSLCVPRGVLVVAPRRSSRGGVRGLSLR